MENEKPGEKRETRAVVSDSTFEKKAKVANRAEQGGTAKISGLIADEQSVLVNEAQQGEASIDRVTMKARSNVSNEAVGSNAAAEAKKLEIEEDAVVENSAQIQTPSIVSDMEQVSEEAKNQSQYVLTAAIQNVVVKEHATVINQSVVNILPEQKSELPEIWRVPPDNESYFMGRDELLENILGSFSLSKTKSILTLQPAKLKACYGLGGIGKTQLALRYARKNKKDYTSRLWFLAESVESLMQDYRDFCNVANIPLPPQASNQVVIDKVKNFLSKHPKLLLVYDNAENYDAISCYLPRDGKDMDIIITSRHQKGWPNPMPVDLPTQEEAVALVKKRIGIDLIDIPQDKEVNELVILLDRLPLALAQAAAYIKESNISIFEYIQQYKSESTLLGEHELNNDEYPTSVLLTWVITMGKIAQEQPLALQALYYCAYLAPDNIPTVLLDELITQDYQSLRAASDEKGEPVIQKSLLNKIRTCLCHYSMIQYDSKRKLIHIHRLVQVVIRCQESNATKAHLFAHRLKPIAERLDDLYPYEKQLKDYEKARNLLPHLEAMELRLQPYTKKPKKAGDDDNSARICHVDLLHAIGDFYSTVTGNAGQALVYHQRALNGRLGIYGEEHSHVATSYEYLGTAYQNLGDLKNALDRHKKALKIRRKVYEDKCHPNIAMSYGNLAFIYQASGNLKKALTNQRKALDLQLKIHGEKHRNVATSYSQVGTLIYQISGNAQEDVICQQKALDIYSDIYGEEHPDTATCYGNLGTAYRNLGCDLDNTQEALKNMRKALINQKKSLEIHLKVYKEGWHPEIALNHGQLGIVYKGLKDVQNARMHLEKALLIYRYLNRQEDIETVEKLLAELQSSVAPPATLPRSPSTSHFSISRHFSVGSDIGLKLRKSSAENDLSKQDYFSLLLQAKRCRVINSRNKNGRTALHLASYKGHYEIVLLLLKAGADPTITDNLGKTPLKHAEEQNHIEIIRALQTANESQESQAGSANESEVKQLLTSFP